MGIIHIKLHKNQLFLLSYHSNTDYTDLTYAFQEQLTLKVLVTTIDALGHFETGYLQHSARGWGR